MIDHPVDELPPLGEIPARRADHVALTPDVDEQATLLHLRVIDDFDFGENHVGAADLEELGERGQRAPERRLGFAEHEDAIGSVLWRRDDDVAFGIVERCELPAHPGDIAREITGVEGKDHAGRAVVGWRDADPGRDALSQFHREQPRALRLAGEIHPEAKRGARAELELARAVVNFLRAGQHQGDPAFPVLRDHPAGGFADGPVGFFLSIERSDDGCAQDERTKERWDGDHDAKEGAVWRREFDSPPGFADRGCRIPGRGNPKVSTRRARWR